jgi:hypothetical protein
VRVRARVRVEGVEKLVKDDLKLGAMRKNSDDSDSDDDNNVRRRRKKVKRNIKRIKRSRKIGNRGSRIRSYEKKQ